MGNRFNKKPSVMTAADYREFADIRWRDLADANRDSRNRNIAINYRINEYNNSKYGPDLPPPKPSRPVTPKKWTIPLLPDDIRKARLPAGAKVGASLLGKVAYPVRVVSTGLDLLELIDGQLILADAPLLKPAGPPAPRIQGATQTKDTTCNPYFNSLYPGPNQVARVFANDVTAQLCVQGQSTLNSQIIINSAGQPTGNSLAVASSLTTFSVVVGPTFLTSGAPMRNGRVIVYTKPNGQTATFTMPRTSPQYGTAVNSAFNPNLLRGMLPSLSLEHFTGTGNASAPSAASRARERLAWEISTGGGRAGAPPTIKTAVRRPAGSQPPGRSQREKKTKNGGVLLFGILDGLSEAGDAIDAIFEALPEKTKKRAKCDRDDFLIDKGGQYGIQNADCKLATLWNNWHKLDGELALRNLIANQIEDKVIGELMRRLPRNIGQAANPAIQELAALLEDFFQKAGLIPND